MKSSSNIAFAAFFDAASALAGRQEQDAVQNLGFGERQTDTQANTLSFL
jgi:hypothetical protein